MGISVVQWKTSEHRRRVSRCPRGTDRGGRQARHGKPSDDVAAVEVIGTANPELAIQTRSSEPVRTGIYRGHLSRWGVIVLSPKSFQRMVDALRDARPVANSGLRVPVCPSCNCHVAAGHPPSCASRIDTVGLVRYEPRAVYIGHTA
jgi:hypothetical protein